MTSAQPAFFNYSPISAHLLPTTSYLTYIQLCLALLHHCGLLVLLTAASVVTARPCMQFHTKTLDAIAVAVGAGFGCRS